MVDDNGSRILMIDKHGDAWHAHADASVPGGYRLEERPFAQLWPGRSLGFTKDTHGNLVVCVAGLVGQDTRGDSPGTIRINDCIPHSSLVAAHPSTGLICIHFWVQGLVRVSSDGRKELLAGRVSADSAMDPGTPITWVSLFSILHGIGSDLIASSMVACGAESIQTATNGMFLPWCRFANNADVASDGTVYFTDSQAVPIWPFRAKTGEYDAMESFMVGYFSASQTGRLLRFNPHNHTTHVLARGLW